MGPSPAPVTIPVPPPQQRGRRGSHGGKIQDASLQKPMGGGRGHTEPLLKVTPLWGHPLTPPAPVWPPGHNKGHPRVLTPEHKAQPKLLTRRDPHTPNTIKPPWGHPLGPAPPHRPSTTPQPWVGVLRHWGGGQGCPATGCFPVPTGVQAGGHLQSVVGRISWIREPVKGPMLLWRKSR